ncbi:efflux transporter outer membrane subunit [Qipengyuania nanhaisediminis]|uniref:Efflux transporter, outer membrane factor (OMF) lipoprotein, NodT family n=1 Tax=Qipengyuania nanhaisediminis TaxID=604088 RepID=A0A1I5KGV9_9SPHN|nr:efflux transporter outer membrane subunit [Qipengyuania nanhaisediminis]SFO83861.1 efflux transporter, outer membrane factor (OMF) lipoprotein, NodT family [Qipengyuania nanhaisediminis]
MMRLLLASTCVLALAGCVAGPPPEIATPTPVLPAEYLFAPDAASATDLADLLPTDDPAYDTLAAQALASSPTLGEALARIDQARAGADLRGANRLPSVGANATVEGRRSNPAQFGGDLPSAIAFDTEQLSYAANVTARWDPDIFGRLRAQERAALARIDAASSSARGVRNALLAEIAASVIDWRTLDARASAIKDDLAAAEELARLSRVREDAGIAPGFDRVRAESAADASRSRLAALESERARLIGRLVTLTAQGGAQVRSALAIAPRESGLPAAPATLPSALLANRPDVLAAAATLAAQDAELAAAARRRFPVFDLSAAIGLLAFSPGDLFDSDSIIGSLAASVAAPLLDFGRIEAEIDGAAAEKRAAFEAYRQAVYTALGDAEGAYGLVAAADREAAAAAQEAASLQRAASLAEVRQRAGLADFLTVLEARRAADASGERAAAALGRAERARVILWQALGGDTQPITRSTNQ